MSSGDPTVLLQFSDLHLRSEDPGPEQRLQRAIDAAATLRPRPGALL